MKTLEQKMVMARSQVTITFADTGYLIFVEGNNSRGDFVSWRGVVTSLPEVFNVLERINIMEKVE
jgi:hypothetical protein